MNRHILALLLFASASTVQAQQEQRSIEEPPELRLLSQVHKSAACARAMSLMSRELMKLKNGSYLRSTASYGYWRYSLEGRKLAEFREVIERTDDAIVSNGPDIVLWCHEEGMARLSALNQTSQDKALRYGVELAVAIGKERGLGE